MSVGTSMINRGVQGAGVGTSISPGYGTLFGGVAGLGLGLFEGLSEDSNKKAARRAIKDAIDQYGEDSEIVKNMLDNYYAGDYSLGTKDDVTRYRTEFNKYNPNDYIYSDYEDFDKDAYNVQDYYDANRGNQINAAANAVQAAAAGQGIGRGTGAANAIANAVVNKNSELGDEAWNRLTSDRTFDYNLWKDNIDINQSKLDALNQGQQYILSNYKDLANSYLNNEADKVQNYMDYYNNLNTNLLNSQLAKAGTYL